ncbi:MAG: PCRF domain-containing protein [Candidatus Hodgkinia cicadicola]
MSTPADISYLHRIQRIPSSESRGRIHTSTATVAVLPKLQNPTEVNCKNLQEHIKRMSHQERRLCQEIILETYF